MGPYDLINKQKVKYEAKIQEKDAEILNLNKKLEELQNKHDALRKEMYEAGLGKGKINELKGYLVAAERDNRTLKNQLEELNDSKIIKTFSSDRQELIQRITKLKLNNSIFDSLAYKFKDGLSNVIQLAYRIKNKIGTDMDYFTFVFRDDIVGLLEKMLRVVLNAKEESATRYLVKIRDSIYSFPKQYSASIPALKNKNVIDNILKLINLETTGYHGKEIGQKKLFTDKETGQLIKPDPFLNLSNEEQLDAIFTLLEFMYFVFTNKDYETNLLSISQYWFKTI